VRIKGVEARCDGSQPSHPTPSENGCRMFGSPVLMLKRPLQVTFLDSRTLFNDLRRS